MIRGIILKELENAVVKVNEKNLLDYLNKKYRQHG